MSVCFANPLTQTSGGFELKSACLAPSSLWNAVRRFVGGYEPTVPTLNWRWQRVDRDEIRGTGGKITCVPLDYLCGHMCTCGHSNPSELGAHLSLPRR